MLPRFNTEQLAQLDNVSIEYKNAYIQAVSNAITDYLAWMNKNAKRSRLLGRLSHFFHGSSGRERAQLLQQSINDQNIKFSKKVMNVCETIQESGFCQHSLRRYVYQYMNKDKKDDVMDPKNPVSDDNFARKVVTSVKTELKDYQSNYNELNFEKISFWCLTNVSFRDVYTAQNASAYKYPGALFSDSLSYNNDDDSSYNDFRMDDSFSLGYPTQDNSYHGYTEVAQHHDRSDSDIVAHIGHH